MTSSENQVHSEDSPLLGNSPRDCQLNEDPPKEEVRFSPATLLIPIALATRVGTQLPTTMALLWILSVRSSASFGMRPKAIRLLCETPEVERYFAIAIAALSVMDGISTLVNCGVLSYFASRYGKKSTILLELAAGVMGCSLIIGSQLTPNWLAAWLLFPGVWLQALSNLLVYGYLINMYIVDVSTAENRTAALSMTTGWATLCAFYSMAAFFLCSDRSAQDRVYLFVATFAYVAFVLPEAFPRRKRDELRRLEREQRDNGSATTTRGSGSTSVFLVVLEPLKSLVPRRKSDGTRNWRLLWCAVHTLVVTTANIYVVPAWFVIVTTKYHFTPEQTGLFLTIVNVSAVFTLTVIVPPLFQFLRLFYERQLLRHQQTKD
ncbi:hypothetical protein PAXINDRAFT_155853 [Paxillus involutus ATCC 200175]|uniref:Uncharacterized protein n=1 Tax=Paxillus involutus ATCC 200175 TaxID=664439 RepID=A0A0C9SYF3_PAXIN|nr:hypothetical protein PAXINDRAFT_155853 [Paxillus involutus ATCC 200175]